MASSCGLPSISTVSATWPAGASGSGWAMAARRASGLSSSRRGELKRSVWMRSAGTPAARSAVSVASIMASGPQMKTSSMLAAGSRVPISCRTLAASMRPSSSGTSCAWRDSTWISVRRFLYLSFRSCSASLNITLPMRRLP